MERCAKTEQLSSDVYKRQVVDEGGQEVVGRDEDGERGDELTPGPAGSEVDEHGADRGKVHPARVGHDTCETVSYTHLDVYKRQRLARAQLLCV